MGKQILFLIVFFSLMSCAQEKSNKVKDIRAQGYLFVFTSIDEPINKDSIVVSIDKTKDYFFIPLEDMQSTFKETLEKVDSSKTRDLYLPLTLTENLNSIKSTSHNLKYYLKNDSLDLFQLEEYTDFYTKPKTRVKLIDSETEKWFYEIVYIDGIWNKIEIPFKWVEALSVGRYRTNNLDRNYKEGYNYYFLKSINVIAYDLDINEKETLLKLDN